jgi:hypothetical protein
MANRLESSFSNVYKNSYKKVSSESDPRHGAIEKFQKHLVTGIRSNIGLSALSLSFEVCLR